MKYLILSVLIVLSASVAIASTNTMYDLGSPDYRWRDSYFKTNGQWGLTNWSVLKVRSCTIHFNDIEVGESNGVLYIDTHGQGTTEAASNILNCVIDLFKQNGYKLVR